jgi:hypothetical protein
VLVVELELVEVGVGAVGVEVDAGLDADVEHEGVIALTAPLTPAQTVGPYLAIGLPWDEGPVAYRSGVRISGRVLDGRGKPVPDALVETWDPQSGAFARCPTDEPSEWSVVTPAAPHLAVNVLAQGCCTGSSRGSTSRSTPPIRCSPRALRPARDVALSVARRQSP